MSRKPVPMFPLPDFYLFPGCIVPLHIFEERYRKMVRDLLDTAGRLVMASIPGRLTGAGRAQPPVFPVGALAEIVHHEPLEDGRYLILIIGLGRVKISEITSESLYRTVCYEPLETVACPEHEEKRLRPLLEKALRERAGPQLDMDSRLSVGNLADLLLQSMKLVPAQLEEIFPEPRDALRAKRALALHSNGGSAQAKA